MQVRQPAVEQEEETISISILEQTTDQLNDHAAPDTSCLENDLEHQKQLVQKQL